MSDHQYWFITAQWIQMPPAIVSITGGGGPQNMQPMQVMQNSVIQVHPAVWADKQLRRNSTYILISAIPLPNHIYAAIAESQRQEQLRIQQEQGEAGTTDDTDTVVM